MTDFNNIPKAGTFGNIVDVINANFSLAKEAIDKTEYTKSNCLGYYATSSALATAHPTAFEGDWAFVGSETPYSMYVYTGGSWTDTGTEYDITVTIADRRIDEIEERLATVKTGVTTPDGFYYTDSVGNVAFQYTPAGGFDAAKVSDHFVSMVGAAGYDVLSETVYSI